MLMLTSFLPLVNRNLPRGLGSFHLYAPIWFASLAYFHHKLFLNKFFLLYGLIFIGILLNTLWVDMDDWNRKGIIQEFYYFSVAISVILYFKITKDYIGLAWLSKWILIFIGITAIMTIYSATIDPMYARKITGGDMETINEFNKLGGGGYSFAIALIALFPMLFYYYQNNRKVNLSKKVIFFYGILCFFALVKLQFFTNILLSVVVITVALLGRKRMKQSLIIMGILLIFFILIPKTIYADLLMSIGSLFDAESNIYYKLNDMANYLVQGDRYATAVEHRTDRYPLLFKAFIQNPVFGRFVGYQEVVERVGEGGHLYWMNRLTTVGIFGFIPVLLVHYGYIKSAIKYFSKEFTFYFLIAVFAVLVLGLMKVLGGRELWFTYFILLPGLYFLPLLKKRKLTPPDKEINKREKSKYPTWLL